MLQRIDDEADAGEEERHRQQLAHGRAAPQKAELGVGLAEEFADRARDRIDRLRSADDQARPLQRAGAHQQRQHDEQQQAFQPRLIELARMPRPAARRWETPSPTARRPARPHNSPLMKLARRPRNMPDRSDRAGDVAERQDRNAALAREQHHRHHAAGEAAMERHAAVPQLHDLQRVCDEDASRL